LTREAAEALAKVQADVRPMGYTLKVYDGYRPQRAVDAFVRWAADPDDDAMRAEFYPDVPKDRLFPGKIHRRTLRTLAGEHGGPHPCRAAGHPNRFVDAGRPTAALHGPSWGAVARQLDRYGNWFRLLQ